MNYNPVKNSALSKDTSEINVIQRQKIHLQGRKQRIHIQHIGMTHNFDEVQVNFSLFESGLCFHI